MRTVVTILRWIFASRKFP